MSLAQVNELYENLNIQSALDLFDKISLEQPQGFDYHLMHIKLLNYQDKETEVINLAEKLLASDINQNQKIAILLELLLMKTKLYEIQAGFDLIKEIEQLDYASTQIKLRINHYKVFLLVNSGMLEDALQIALINYELVNTINDNKWLAFVNNRVGYVYDFMGDLNEAEIYYKRSVDIIARFATNKYSLRYHHNLANIYKFKGELQKSFQYLKKTGEIARELRDYPWIGQNFNDLGTYYFAIGEEEKAVEYYLKSLEILEEYGKKFDVYYIYGALFEFYIDNKNLSKAEYYLEKIKITLKDSESVFLTQSIRLYTALLHKLSSRYRKKAKAMDLLEEIFNEEIVDHEITYLAILNYCEILVQELLASSDPDIFEELKVLIGKLLEFGSSNQSHAWMAKALVLQSILDFIGGNFDGAKKQLSQAQMIADEKGYLALAVRISDQYDQLIEQIRAWEDRETMDLESLIKASDLEQTVRKTTEFRLEAVQIVPETPVALLILNLGTGVASYSRQFTHEAKYDQQLFASFMSAINTFGKATFSSEGLLDRIKFGKYDIMIDKLEKNVICYIYTGQSYNAHLRLRHFSSNLLENKKIRKYLNSETTELRRDIIAMIDDVRVKIF